MMIDKTLINHIYKPVHVLATMSLFVSASWGCNQFSEKSENQSKKPNVVIIYADDLGYGDIGTYGAKLIPTPNIDLLAETGLKMKSAYASAATCTPSRYSLLTGAYAFRNENAQILDGDDPLLIKPGTTTIPSLFKEAGYRTSIIGKWHLGLGDNEVNWNGIIKPGPLEIGFDESFIIPTTTDRVPTVYLQGHHVYGLKKNEDALRISYEEKIGDLPTGVSNPELLRYPADLQHSGTIVAGISRIGWQDGGQSAWWDDEKIGFTLVEHAQNFIEENKDGPFFLFLSMHENHVPRAPNPMFVNKSQTGLRGDAIVELDWIVNQVMFKLDELGLRENTLVIFTSDNGPIFDDGYDDGAIEKANGHPASGPLRGGKYTAFEGGTRIPFIVNWRGTIEAGKITDAIYSQIDLMASLAALIGVELREGEGPDSFNLLPVLLGKNNKGREQIIQQGSGVNFYGIRKGDWKLIPSAPQRKDTPNRKHNSRPNPLSTPQVSTGTYLFNLAEDPGETVNLTDEHPEIVDELSKLLESILETPETLIKANEKYKQAD